MKTKIMMSHFYAPCQQLKRLVDSADGMYVCIGTGKHIQSAVEEDQWAAQNMHLASKLPVNIDYMNGSLNECSHLYAFWKNKQLLGIQDADWLGVCHYRRFFDKDKLEHAQSKFDIVCAEPTSLGFIGWHYGLEQQYKAAHVASDFDKFKDAMKKMPMYNEEDFSRWLKYRVLVAPCNLVVMKHELFDQYCSDLFTTLLPIVESIDVSGRDNYQRRFGAFLAERFTSFWVVQQSKKYNIGQLPVEYHPEWKPSDAADKRGVFS